VFLEVVPFCTAWYKNCCLQLRFLFLEVLCKHHISRCV
jgi:hypothetical protein